MDAHDLFVRPSETYLLSHSVGLPLRNVDQAMADVTQVWAESPAAAWPSWLATIDAFRNALAGLLGGDAASICPQTNVSSGLTKILQAIRPPERTPSLLLAELAFPSIGYVCTHAGYDVRWLDAELPATDVDVWAEHLDPTLDVVVITHVHSNTGELLPVAEIVDAARRRGITTIVDVAQSVGVIPIDVNEWGADAVVGSCVKWLCGGPGAGWLWASDELVERSAPTDVGWFSHDDPFEFDIHRFRYADDALRFWGGTAAVLPYAIARRSIEVIDGIGVDAVRAHNLHLGRALVDGLGERVVSPHDDEIRSGTTIISGGPELVDTLARDDIAVDHRAHGIRISPHVYNTEEDIAALLTALA